MNKMNIQNKESDIVSDTTNIDSPMHLTLTAL